MEIFELKLTK